MPIADNIVVDSLLRHSGESLVIKDHVIKDSVNLERSEYWNGAPRNLRLKIERCTFKSTLSLKDFLLLEELEFEDCVFHSQVLLKDATFSLSITKCVFHGPATFSFSGNNKHHLSHSVFLTSLAIIGSCQSIHITNLNKTDFTNSNLLSQCEGNIVINAFSCSDFKLEKSVFKALTMSKLDKYFNVLSLVEIDVRKILINGTVTLKIYDSTVDEFNVLSTSETYQNIISLYQSTISTASVSCYGIDKLDITRCTIDDISLYDTLGVDKSINVITCKINKFDLSYLTNKGSMSIREISGCSNLSMLSSTLGKSDIMLCDFSKAKFFFANSKLSELFLVDVDFPKVVFTKNQRNYKQSQLAFGQINTAYQKQGDTIRAIEYQAREVEAHYKDLLAHKKYFNVTTWALGLNRISNDFGRNWGMGFLFTVAVGTLFFYCLVLSTTEYSFGFPISFDERLWHSFMKFMNPLRFFEAEAVFKNGENAYVTFGFWSYLFDFLGRIAVAYGVYQTIQAFRRYGRK